MLAKVSKIEVTQFYCGGKLRKISAIHDCISICRYLRHLGLDPDQPIGLPGKVVGMPLAKMDAEKIFHFR